MLLKSIRLKNFRQFANEQIDFSTDPAKNVTLIIGENGTGKTTFAQAFFWCLYGVTDFNDSILLNKHVGTKMTPDEKAEVRVTLRLTHGTAEYEIVRKQEYKKSNSNRITGANTVLSIAIKSPDGNTRYLKPGECEVEIKKILPQELSHYFFFDGERIEKMSKEIASGKKSSGFSEAVTGLTGLKATLSAIGHLNPNYKNSVVGKFNSEYKADSDSKLVEYTKKIEKLDEDLAFIEKRLEEIESDVSAATARKTQLEKDIKQYEEGKKLQDRREKLEKDLKNAQHMKGMQLRQLTTTFNQEMEAFFTLSLAKRSLELLSTTDFLGKDIPEMHAKTIEFLLKRGQCICGTDLAVGSMAYKQVVSLLDYLPPQSIGVTVGQFVKDTRMLFNKDSNLYTSVCEQLENISIQDGMISDINEELVNLAGQLGDENASEQVKYINSQIQVCNSIISKGKNEREKLIEQRGAKKTERDRQETERAKLSLLDQTNRLVETYKAYAIQIFNELNAEYREREVEIRNKLENYINDIFKRIYNGGLSLSIDEKYNISVYVTDFEEGVETSTAQSISVIFAFITAIIKLARENRDSSGDSSYSEPYPLVMDAPLSAFDKRRIEAICHSIPETAEQVIIFIKDTDGDLANEHLGTRVQTRHYFEKVDEFTTLLH